MIYIYIYIYIATGRTPSFFLFVRSAGLLKTSKGKKIHGLGVQSL